MNSQWQSDRFDLKPLLLRIAELEGRVARLETENAGAVPPSPVLASEPAEALLADLVTAEASDAAAPSPAVDDAPALPISQAVELLPYRPREKKPASTESGTLEQTIGLRWTGWIGALVVVIGAVLAVKYAYDAGWIGRAPPMLRLVLMAAGGFGLIGAGEWVYRRVNAISAVGLFASGVGTLFLVAYAGYSVLDVYGRETAFALMLICSLIGSAVAMRGRLLSIAVLSQLGGHLTPLILGGDPHSAVPLLSYLLMLQTVALFLAWWGAGLRWWALRWLALATTSLWVMALLVEGSHSRDVIFGFTLGFAGLFFVEVLLSAIRPAREGDEGARRFTAAHAGSVFLVVVTGMLVVVTLYALRDASPAARGLWLVGYSIVLAAIGFATSATLQPLPLTFRALAAALVVVAVPVAFRGPTVALLWGLMAVVFSVMGARYRLQVSRAASVVTWVGAIVYLAWATQNPSMAPAVEDVAFSLFGTDFHTPMLLAWMLAALGLTIAWQVSRSPDAETAQQAMREGSAIAAIAGVVWVVAAWLQLPPAGATLAIVVLAWSLAGLDMLIPRLGLAVLALTALLVAAVKWALLDLLAERLGDGWSSRQLDYLPVLNPVVMLGSLIAGSIPAICWLRRGSLLPLMEKRKAGGGSRPLAVAAVLAFGLLFGFGLTLEIDRVIVSAADRDWTLDLRPGHVRQLCFTLLWSTLCGIAAALMWRLESDLDQRRRWLAFPYGAAIVLAIKYLVVDTLAWRAVGLGDATVLLNLEMLSALLILGLLVPLYRELRPAGSVLAKIGGFLALLMVLWVGMMEIGRAVTSLGGSGLTLQLVVTLWWSSLAISLVLGGLFLRIAGMRYFGLTLFALTLAKLFAIDLRFLDRGWRTLAFIATGLFLIGTSVVYGKYSPRLLGRLTPEEPRI